MPSPRYALVVLALLLLAGCGPAPTETPYQRLGPGGGYSDQQIERNRFRISFKGNSLTSREVVETYLLYRAAEVTLANGHDHFVLTGRDIDRAVQYETTGPSYGLGYGFGLGGGLGLGLGLGTTTTREIDRYEAVAEILAYPGPKPAGDRLAYDAREVIASLEPRVLRPVALR